MILQIYQIILYISKYFINFIFNLAKTNRNNETSMFRILSSKIMSNSEQHVTIVKQ